MLAGILTPVISQDAESKAVRVRINNLPDQAPPEIRIVSPVLNEDRIHISDAEEIVLIGEVSDQSTIKFITVNDQFRSLNEDGLFSSQIHLSPGNNTVTLIASDDLGNLTERTISIEYKPPVVTLAERITTNAKYYSLIIGINQYEDPGLPDLDNPIKDAENVFQALTTGYTFEETNAILLRNPKRIEIVDALDYLSKVVTENDNLLIFYAGHGNWDERADLGYWLPSDASLSSSGNWFRNSALVDYLKLINSKHTLLITDACFSGSIFKSRSGFPQAERAYEVQYELSSRKAMTSGNLTEVPDRSAFTRYLIERLNENKNQYMTSWELFGSMRNAVINNSDALPVYGVIQNVGDEGGEFIFLKRK